MAAVMTGLERLFRDHLSLVTRDFDSWLALLDDEIHLSFPYAASVGNSPSLRGKDAVAEAVRSFLEAVPDLAFVNASVHPTLLSDEGFATYEVDTVVPSTGRRYAQDYIAHFRARNGRLSYISEYYDPVRLMKAFELPILM